MTVALWSILPLAGLVVAPWPLPQRRGPSKGPVRPGAFPPATFRVAGVMAAAARPGHRQGEA